MKVADFPDTPKRRAAKGTRRSAPLDRPTFRIGQRRDIYVSADVGGETRKAAEAIESHRTRASDTAATHVAEEFRFRLDDMVVEYLRKYLRAGVQHGYGRRALDWWFAESASSEWRLPSLLGRRQWLYWMAVESKTSRRLGNESERQLRRDFASGSWDEGIRFVAQHPHLIPLLRELPNEVAKAFDGRQELDLAVVQEDDQSLGQLVVSIRTALAPDAARKSLVAFDDVWWLDRLRDARGRLVVTTEFV